MSAPLTQQQLERIAKNRAEALERKRKHEEGTAGLCEANKRLSSAATPRHWDGGREPRWEREGGWTDEEQYRQAHGLSGRPAWQRPSADEWVNSAPVRPQHSAINEEKQAPGSPLAPSAKGNRPSAESWVEEGTDQVGWKVRGAPPASFAQSTLSFGKAGSGLSLSLPSGGAAQPSEGERVREQKGGRHQMPAALLKGPKGPNLDRGAKNGGMSAEDQDEVLTQEQKIVKEKVMNGANIFLTGGAGTGKSFLVQNLIVALKRARGREAVAITATTGIAASPLGGTSLHSWTGIGLGKETPGELADRVKKNRSAKARWQNVKVLIVDEVSMLNCELLEKLDRLAQLLRKNERPFGGIQLLLVGDFLQLPPVPDDRKPVQFCFESKLWNRLVEHHCELKVVHRQANAAFVQVLNQVRLGACTAETTAVLRNTSTNKVDEGGITATKLYTTNQNVDDINVRCLKKIDKQSIFYDANDTGSEPFLSQLRKNCLAPERLELKEGAQVMLLKNLDQENGLVNGTRGFVVHFENNENPDVGPVGHYPMVRFLGCKGTMDRLMTPDKFSIESQGSTLASREQVPVRLAYALTIHKCQGMTLSRAELSLGSAFEYGQAYVALSRVQSLEGLRVIDFDPRAVKAHPKVLKFYQELQQRDLEAQRASGQRPNPLDDWT